MSRFAKEVNTCLVKIREGDKSAMTPLYNLTANHLKGMIYIYLKNKLYLDDVLSDTYERVLLYIDSFDADRDGYNWLCEIAKNRAYTYDAIETHRMEADLINGGVVLDDWENLLETQIDLSRAMKDISDVDKKVLFMRHYMQAPLSEIAKELGVSKTAVFLRLQRIYKNIRKKY